MTTCPFCGCNPFEYVDVGVGSVPVAVTCCELGHDYFTPPHQEASETVTISRHTFNSIADIFRSMRTLGLSPEIEL